VPTRHAAGRPDPSQPRAVRDGGHAAVAQGVPRGSADPAAGRGGRVVAGLTDEMLSTAVGKVAVARGGAGRPVVYLHSATGEGAGFGLLEELADSFDVVAPVFPGFGESEGLDAIDDVEDAAFHVLDVLDVLGLDRPALVG